ncbi:MAG: C40 family peptidase [Clostridia bacterium]|nr:C40 family peptidase [Clostridia bacterium]
MKIKIIIAAALIAVLITAVVGCGQAYQPSDGPDITPIPPVSPNEPTDTDEPDVPVTGNPDDVDRPAMSNRYDVVLISTVDSLNVRSGKGSSYSSLGTLDKGDGIAKLGEAQDGWYPTVYRERTAYVSAAYVREQRFAMGDDKTEKVVEEGKKLLGHPYVWGSQRYHWGNGNLNTAFKAGEFDCSALMQYIFYKGASVNLDLNTRTQVLQGKEVSRADLKRGDLMFFTNASRYNKTGVERIGHVALYLGDNYILHTASDHAVIEPISATRWGYYIVSRDVL